MPKENISEKGIKEIKRPLCDEAHQKLLYYASVDDAKRVLDVLEQNVNLDIGFDINYVKDSFNNGVRCEQTALIIALRGGHTETADCLIENGADLNQALSLAFLFFSEDSLLLDDLISRKADVEKAFNLVIEHKYINDYERKKRREIRKIWERVETREGWEKEKRQRKIWERLGKQAGREMRKKLQERGKELKKQEKQKELERREEQEKIRKIWKNMGGDMGELKKQEELREREGRERQKKREEWEDREIQKMPEKWEKTCKKIHEIWEEARLRKLGKLPQNNEEDEEHKKLNSKLLLLALKHNPRDGVLLQRLCLLKGTSINDALSLAIKSHQPGDESSILWLISNLIDKDTADKTRSGTSTDLSMTEPAKLEVSVKLNDALRMILEKMPEKRLVTVILKISEIMNIDKVLYHILKHTPENDKLRSKLISKGANLNTLLGRVIKEKPREHERMISTLISKGANVNSVVDSEKNYRILHEAIDRGCSEAVIQYLLERGADPNEKMTLTKGGCEQIGFALVTLTNPIGWFYLSYLFCARGDCGNPFTEKYIDALELARLRDNLDAKNALVKKSSQNEKTPLLGNGETEYRFFSSGDEKGGSKSDEVHLTIAPGVTPSSDDTCHRDSGAIIVPVPSS